MTNEQRLYLKGRRKMTGEEEKKYIGPLADVMEKHPHIDKDHMAKEIMEMLRGMPRLKGNLKKRTFKQRHLFQSFKARRRRDG